MVLRNNLFMGPPTAGPVIELAQEEIIPDSNLKRSNFFVYPLRTGT